MFEALWDAVQLALVGVLALLFACVMMGAGYVIGVSTVVCANAIAKMLGHPAHDVDVESAVKFARVVGSLAALAIVFISFSKVFELI